MDGDQLLLHQQTETDQLSRPGPQNPDISEREDIPDSSKQASCVAAALTRVAREAETAILKQCQLLTGVDGMVIGRNIK